jgi:hypothetical protein
MSCLYTGVLHNVLTVRLRSMDPLVKPLDKSTADSGADEVADSDSDTVRIMDIHVAGMRGGYVINVTYEAMGEVRRRVLRSLDDVDRFLTEPIDLFDEASSEVQSWDVDMGL